MRQIHFFRSSVISLRSNQIVTNKKLWAINDLLSIECKKILPMCMLFSFFKNTEFKDIYLFYVKSYFKNGKEIWNISWPQWKKQTNFKESEFIKFKKLSIHRLFCCFYLILDIYVFLHFSFFSFWKTKRKHVFQVCRGCFFSIFLYI